uniref:Uncharacterized protein n=1 Tax=Anguilla anguilla TaxID=7936 RepID=A0A0E9VAB4_ANGAN
MHCFQCNCDWIIVQFCVSNEIISV